MDELHPGHAMFATMASGAETHFLGKAGRREIVIKAVSSPPGMIPELQQAFGSLIKSLEILYVMEGAKPCARIMAKESEKERILAVLEERGLKHAMSNFKVVKQDLQPGQYSDRSIKLPLEDEREGFLFLYVSKEKEKAKKACELEEARKHAALGEALGYPACCCGFFEEHFTEQHADLTLDALEETDDYEFPFHTNVAGRHFDISLLSHFPCQFDCPESVALGKKHLEIIARHLPPLAEKFEDFLRSAVFYSELNGVFFLRDASLEDSTLRYGKVLTSYPNRLYEQLAAQKKLTVNSNRSITLAGEEIGGEGFGFLLFG